MSVVSSGTGLGTSFPLPIEVEPNVVKLTIAALLGMFLGLEREWSEKAAGIRTFALISLLGALFTIVGSDALTVLGGLLIIVQGVLLAVRGLYTESGGYGLSLTTSMSMLVTYGIGVLVGMELYLEGIVVAVFSSLLLVFKRELHQFAWALSKEEVKSATEFAIIAFVIYPILPNEAMGPWDAINPQTVWILVVAVSGIGFVNYIIVQQYGSKGMAVTGFFGGLVNSTAVIGEMASRAKSDTRLRQLAVGTILMADAAMALRNMVISVLFLPEFAVVLSAPLLGICVFGIVFGLYLGNWGNSFSPNFQSPFSFQNALKFGALFVVVLLITAGAENFYGSAGFVLSSLLSGLVSSGTTTTTAVILAESGQIDLATAAAGVVAGTVSSILVKIGFVATIDRSLLPRVTIASGGLVAAGVVTLAIVFSMVGP
jgi:uncharacterized membrane protein (DUF4010 family)